MDIADWLRGLGLEHCEQALRDHEIDQDILLDLTEGDLATLGLPLGSRKKLLKAIEALRQGAGVFDPSSALSSAHVQEQRSPSLPTAERRQLTVVFCDLVGSTALSARLDPEDLRDVISNFQSCVTETASRFGGFIAKYMGDGVLVYFGYPQAREDDAERAVRAGLALVDAIGRLEGPEQLRVRIGIATGLVVVGDLIGRGSAREQTVVGETPNLAARLQASADPDTVVVAQSTRRIVGDLFNFRALGALRLKGFPQPVQAWQALDVAPIASRFEALHAAAGLTPLVGRNDEIALLLERWAQAREAKGQVVVLSGEPGIGKSRLIAALREQLECEPHACLRFYCSPRHTDSPLFPIICQLEQAADFKRNDTEEIKLSKLKSLLWQSSAQDDNLMLIADLLSLPTEQWCSPPDLTPKQRREKTLAVLARQLAGLAQRSPVLIVFEDVHWIDPSSLDALSLAVGQVQHLPVLLIMTARPEFKPPWIGSVHVTELRLSCLDPHQGQALARLVAGGKVLPSEILDQISARTDGVPLFVEELTKTVLESGILREEHGHYVFDGQIQPIDIPTSLHTSLIARLDRLSPSARELAQVGAAIGREFPYTWLAAIIALPEAQLRRALEELTRAELVTARGTAPEVHYLFKHALVQHAAYSTLLRDRRRELHARIVAVLEKDFPDVPNSQPELLAHHCTQSALIEHAAGYGYKAGQLAIRRSAMAEAVAHFSRALDLLAGAPDTAQRRRLEFQLQLARAGALEQSSGWASPEMGYAYSRACELSETAEGVSDLERVSALYGLRQFRVNRAELAAARDVADELRRLGEAQGNKAGLALGHRALGVIVMFQGSFDAAARHFALVLGNYDPAVHEASIFFAVPSGRIAAIGFTAWIRLFQGHLGEARERSCEALDRARDLANPYSLAFSLHVNCLFNQVWGDWHVVGERSASLVSLSDEHGFAHLLATGTFFRGWAAFSNGDVDDGIALMKKGLAAKRAGGAEIKVPYYLGVLADAYRQIGRVSDALPLLIEALERVEETGEKWFEAELHRLKAEALGAQASLGDSGPRVEVLLNRALSVARSQGARLWELRASMSLARLWRDQGRHTDAGKLLAPVLGLFTEDIHLPDLRHARELLGTLRR